MTTATAPNIGFSHRLRLVVHPPTGADYFPPKALEVTNSGLVYVDSKGRAWPIPRGFGYDGPSTPEALRSVGPDWRKVLYQSALHDLLTRRAGSHKKLGGVALSEHGSSAVPYQWRVADHLWWESMQYAEIPDDKRSAYWLAVRLGSIRRTRQEYGLKAWGREIAWTMKQAYAKNRLRLIGSYLWGLFSMRWIWKDNA